MNPPKVSAEVRFLTPEDGGRKTRVFSGYRGQFHYENNPQEAFDAVWHFPNVPYGAPISFGENVRAVIDFPPSTWASVHAHQLKPGTCFTIQEGGKVVARGTIREVL